MIYVSIYLSLSITYVHIIYIYIGSLEVKLPTIWTNEKQRWEESEKRREEERISKKRKSQKKEDPGERKGRKVATHFVFPMICGSGGSKSRLAKAAGAEPAGQMRGEKMHAVVARSTFRSQNVQSTPAPDHFWKLRCRKSASLLWREAHFEVKSAQKVRGAEHFWTFRCRGRRTGLCTLSKVSKT